MHPNETLLKKFYQALRDKNLEDMLCCYHPNATFTDPVFGALHGEALKGMWMMVLEKSPDLTIQFNNIQAGDKEGKAEWTSTYRFSKTNRIIENKIHSRFRFQEGLIHSHKDFFSLWKWAGMALGVSGYILGFTAIIQNQIRLDAQNSLKIYLKRRKIS
jgi:ketosteroid isomerase-like protein